jgi:predicted AAA+ superfamily ATPase
MKNGFEYDFITVSASGIKDIIQVCHDISDPYTLKREVKGITAAAKKLGLKRGTIITYDQQDTIQESDVSIDIVPLPIFLCEN